MSNYILNCIFFVVVELDDLNEASFYNNNNNRDETYEIEHLDDNEQNSRRREDYGSAIPQQQQKRRICHEILQEQAIGGGDYGSDGSETLSVNSAQSMQNRYFLI